MKVLLLSIHLAVGVLGRVPCLIPLLGMLVFTGMGHDAAATPTASTREVSTFSRTRPWVEEPAGKPVIDRGAPGAWDGHAVDNPFLLVDGGLLYCFYEGQDKPFSEGGHERIGMAVSVDGFTWEKGADNPILDVGPEGAWDSVVAKLPAVTRLGTVYYMFYSGRNEHVKQIGLATSRDLLTWEKHEDNPVLRGRQDRWDKLLSTHPAAPIRRDGRFYLLYRGMSDYYRDQGLGVAVSSDLIHWERAQEGPVIAVEEEIASLALCRVGDDYVGIAQAPKRSYWFSKNLLDWQRGEAAPLTGNHVDTLSNPVWFQGRWMVLYEQQDRIRRATQSPTVSFDESLPYALALPDSSPVGAASIREHAVVWHPLREKFYLVADVVTLNSPHHPNTYESELYLWSGPNLRDWTFIGLVVPKGEPGDAYDAHGVASPAGMAYGNGKLYVPFSARRTAKFTGRSIGLAWSSEDPEQIPWTKSPAPISDLPGEDDDPAALSISGDGRLHLFHRSTGEGGYRIVHTASASPEDPTSWPKAVDVTVRPEGVRAQELTGAFEGDGEIQLFVIEQGDAVGGIQVAHLASKEPDVVFQQANPAMRYLAGQPQQLAYGGHFSPVTKDGKLIAAFWTVFQEGQRYGLAGAPVNNERVFP
jgi:predicted GH43/DUF377 family glycosyl hydrolase